MNRPLTFLATAVALVFPVTASVVEFRRDIEPLFTEHCVKCHGLEKQKGGLRLD